MKVAKVSISLEAELGERVRAAAAKAGMSLSAWLAEAAAAKLRGAALDEFLEEWKAEHGDFTFEELDRAREELRLAPDSGGATKEHGPA
jgi:hypothetical protein